MTDQERIAYLEDCLSQIREAVKPYAHQSALSKTLFLTCDNALKKDKQ